MKTENSSPLILSIETATPVCSVALHAGAGLIQLSEIFIDKSHSSNLVPMIQDVLKKAGTGFAELDAVAVSKGPGSYTGLRIGISTAKGICYGMDIPLIGVGTLDALARRIHNEHNVEGALICPMLDARRMEVYTQLIDNQGIGIEPVQAKIITEDSFNEYLTKHKILFAGPGSLKCRFVFSKISSAVFIDEIEASAATVGEIALEYFRNDIFENTALFEPFYLKEFQTTVPKPVL